MKFVKFSFLTLPAILTVTLPAQAQQQIYTYQCDGGKGFQAEFSPEFVNLTLVDRNDSLTLPRVASASGVSYSDGRTILFTKGEAAFIDIEGKTAYQNCVAQETLAPSQQTNIQTDIQPNNLSNGDRLYNSSSNVENQSAAPPLW